MSEVSDLRRSASRSLIWSVVQTWGGRSVSMLVFFCLARLLTPAEFGLASSAILVFSIAALMSELGIGDALIQQRHLQSSSFDTPFILSVAASLMVAGIVVVFAETIAAFVAVPGLTPFVVSAALLVPFSVVASFQEAMLKRELQFRTLAIRTLIAGVSGGLVGIAMALAGYGAWSLVGQFAVQIIVGAAWLWSRPVWRPGLNLTLESARGIGMFGLNLVGMRLVDFAAMRAVDLIVLTHLGAAAFALFAVSTRLYLFLMQLFQASIASIGLPLLSRVSDDRERLGRIFIRVFSLSTMFGTPVFLLLAAMAPDVSRLMFGERWDGAADIMTPFLVVGGVHCVLFSAGSFLMAVGRADILFRLMILKAGLLLLPLLIIEPETTSGMANLIALGLVLEAPFTVAATLRKLSLTWSSLLRTVGIPFLCSCGAAVAAHQMSATWLTEHGSMVGFAGGALAFVGSYAALLTISSWSIVGANLRYVSSSFKAATKN